MIDENEKLKGTECPNEPCRCMHDFSPESVHRNCIQVRPSRTSKHAKVIFLILIFKIF